MKKVLCIVISLIITVSAFFCCLYAYTLNYDYQKDSTSFQDVISGYPKDMTTIGKYGKDYYNLLDSYTYTCLNFFQASSILLTSDNVQTIRFASSKLFDSEKYDSILAIATVIIKNDSVYVFVSHKTNGRIAHSLYSINNNDFIEQISETDFEVENISSDIVHDSFASSYLFLKKYGIIFAVILLIIIACIFFVSKQKKQGQVTNNR